MKLILQMILCVLCMQVAYAGNISDKTLAKVKKAIVTVESRVAMSAYQRIGNWKGTGFIADKKNGYIVTNAHVIGLGSIGTYFITFDTGQQAEAHLAYYDLWQDQAILKVAPEFMPQNVEEVSFSKEAPKLNQTVFIVGNNEGQSFSVHHGFLASLYDINGEMPQGSYIVNLNVVGGSSGSPLMNESGEAIGLHYGGGQTYGIALKGAYISKVLTALQSGVQPLRRHIGVICELYSLDKAMQHRNFPKDVMEKYISDYPDCRNKVVAVQYTIPGTPAEKVLKAGDIVWKINDAVVKADLFALDNAMDHAAESVKLTIYRDGQMIEENIKTYDVESNKISKLLHFGGAIFFEADDHVSAKAGIPLKALGLVNVQTGSSFSTIPGAFAQDDRVFYRLSPYAISGHNISTLDAFVSVVPSLIQKAFLKIDFKNYQPYFQPFNNILVSGHSELSSDITLDSIDSKPRLMKFDNAKLEWISEDIQLNNK